MDKSVFKNFIDKKFRKQFYFATCILPEYMCHGISKNFWKNNHLFLTKAKCRDMVENNVFRLRQAGQSSAMQGIQKTIDECMDEAGYERVK